MADRTNPFLQIGFSEYEGIHRMPFGLKQRAVTHENNRERVVVSILLDLHLMALSGFIAKNASLGLRGAISQSLEGHDGDAAAHCVPRQLLVATQPPQHILAAKIPERAWALDVLFAETDILPSNFNISDSRAERLGLNDAFLNGCRQAITAGQFGGQMTPDSISTAVSSAFDKFKGDAKQAFQAAVRRLKDKLKPTYLFPQYRSRWTEQLQITEQYEDTLANSNVSQEINFSKIEGLIKIYKLG